MGYLIFMYIVIGLYFVIFAYGTEYNYMKQQSFFYKYLHNHCYGDVLALDNL